MDFNFAYRGSSLTPEAAVEVLTRTFTQAKVAASLGDPTMNVGGAVVPHVPMEAARNALIGAGIGGVGGLVSELGQDEKDRDYRRLLDKTLLGGMIGGGGTLAWRSLANSGNKADPAALQDIYDSAVNPPVAPPDPVRAAVDAKKQQAAPPPVSGGASAPAQPGGVGGAAAAPQYGPVATFFRGVAADPRTPHAIADPLLRGTESTPAQLGTIGAGATAGGLAGWGLASRTNTLGRRLSGLSVPKAPASFGRGGLLFRALAAGAGAYAGGHLGNATYNSVPTLPGN